MDKYKDIRINKSVIKMNTISFFKTSFYNINNYFCYEIFKKNKKNIFFEKKPQFLDIFLRDNLVFVDENNEFKEEFKNILDLLNLIKESEKEQKLVIENDITIREQILNELNNQILKSYNSISKKIKNIKNISNNFFKDDKFFLKLEGFIKKKTDFYNSNLDFKKGLVENFHVTKVNEIFNDLKQKYAKKFTSLKVINKKNIVEESILNKTNNTQNLNVYKFKKISKNNVLERNLLDVNKIYKYDKIINDNEIKRVKLALVEQNLINNRNNIIKSQFKRKKTVKDILINKKQKTFNNIFDDFLTITKNVEFIDNIIKNTNENIIQKYKTKMFSKEKYEKEIKKILISKNMKDQNIVVFYENYKKINYLTKSKGYLEELYKNINFNIYDIIKSKNKTFKKINKKVDLNKNLVFTNDVFKDNFFFNKKITNKFHDLNTFSRNVSTFYEEYKNTDYVTQEKHSVREISQNIDTVFYNTFKDKNRILKHFKRKINFNESFSFKNVFLKKKSFYDKKITNKLKDVNIVSQIDYNDYAESYSNVYENINKNKDSIVDMFNIIYKRISNNKKILNQINRKNKKYNYLFDKKINSYFDDDITVKKIVSNINLNHKKYRKNILGKILNIKKINVNDTQNLSFVKSEFVDIIHKINKFDEILDKINDKEKNQNFNSNNVNSFEKLKNNFNNKNNLNFNFPFNKKNNAQNSFVSKEEVQNMISASMRNLNSQNMVEYVMKNFEDSINMEKYRNGMI